MIVITVTPRQWVGRKDAHRAQYTVESADRAWLTRHVEWLERRGCEVEGL